MKGMFELKKLTLVSTVALFGLMACGGGSDGDNNSSDNNNSNTATINGTAAVGAPISGGTVTVVNANGTTATATTNADGTYTVTVAEAAPYALSVTYGDGEVLYSYASASGVANITPLTSFTLYSLIDEQSMEACVEDWTSCIEGEAIEDIETSLANAIATVNANLQAVYAQSNVVTEYNYFTEPFTADGTSIDAVLDMLNIEVDYSVLFSPTGTGYTISVDGENFDFDADIDTDGITIDFNGTGPNGNTVGDGDWTLVVTGTVSVSGTNVAIPEITVNNIDAPTLSDIQDNVEDTYTVNGNISVEETVNTDSHKQFTVTFVGTYTGVGEVNYTLEYDYTLN